MKKKSAAFNFKKALGRAFSPKNSLKESRVYRLLKNSSLDWSLYSKENGLDQTRGDDPIEYYLRNWKVSRYQIIGEFDSEYYLENNLDVKLQDANPLVHYLIYGKREQRLAWKRQDAGEVVKSLNDSHGLDELNQMFYDDLSACKDLDWGFYKESFGLSDQVDPVMHYLSNFNDIKPVFPGFFDDKLYYKLYPDVYESGAPALWHFVKHGKPEGRLAFLKREEYFENGGQSFNRKLPVIIVCTHESSETGAPVLALEITKRLSEKFNLITVSLKKGGLHKSFVSSGFLHVNEPNKYGEDSVKYVVGELCKDYEIDACLMNSVESLDFLMGAFFFGLPTVSLIHEYSDYTRPLGKLTVSLLSSDVVVFPAESLLLSALSDLKNNIGVDTVPNHLKIRPQGSMRIGKQDELEWSLKKELQLAENAIVIASAGFVQPRKGLDWFLETARHILSSLEKENKDLASRLEFVWLGGGYRDNEMCVSVWASTFMDRVGLTDKCHFPGHVDSVYRAFEEVDIYLLTSKLDPFPNVAIDALDVDCSIACFEQASGIADFVKTNKVRGVTAEYGDCYGLAEEIVNNIDSLLLRDGRNSAICRESLDFSDYIDFLCDSLEEAKERSSSVRSVLERTDFKSIFDSRFYNLNFNNCDRGMHFLSMLRKGIVYSKPFPGSDIQSRLHKYAVGNNFPEYVEEHLIQSNDENADCIMPVKIIDGVVNDSKLKIGRVAVHFHVYYPDLIDEYISYFRTLMNVSADLFVTHVSKLDDGHVDALRQSVSGDCFFIRVDNVGRDVYPFHEVLSGLDVEEYDVIGHFHTKKSQDVGGNVGKRWRRYLLGNLIGSPEATKQILSLFENPEVGLVFAEDRHCSDEASNRLYIEQLLSELDLAPRDNYFYFPLGTMFWARPVALAPLNKLSIETFKIKEPVPYDGSVLHAFERIVPQLVESEGYKIQRVYSNGMIW